MTQAIGDELTRQMPSYKSLKDFGMILKLYPLGTFTPEFMHVFEEYLIDFLSKTKDSISTEDLTYLFNLLSGTKKRPVKILKIMSTALMIRFENSKETANAMEAEHLAGLVFALNKLSYFDIPLLTKICDVLTEVEPSVVVEVKSNTIVTLLTSLGQIRFLHKPLMDKILKAVPEIMSSRKVLRSPELACLLITLSKLGYKPDGLDEICRDFILPNVKRSEVRLESVWIDFLWSLVYLDLVDKSHPFMKDVVNPSSSLVKSIEDRIREGEASCRTDLSKVLNMQALLLAPSSSSSSRLILTKEDDLVYEPPARSNDCQAFSASVTDTLNFFIPRGSHMELGIRTKLGFSIDARFVISSDMKTKSLDKLTSASKIPKGFHRVNVLTASFRQSLLNEPTEATGQVKMQARLVKSALKETVVIVTPNPFLSKNDSVQKVSFLQKLIKDAIYQV